MSGEERRPGLGRPGELWGVGADSTTSRSGLAGRSSRWEGLRERLYLFFVHRISLQRKGIAVKQENAMLVCAAGLGCTPE